MFKNTGFLTISNLDLFFVFLHTALHNILYKLTEFTLKARQTLRATSFSMEVSMTG